MLRILSKAAGIAGYIVQYGCITHCTFEYIGDFVVCNGPSMEPTLYSNNVLITDRISPRLNRIQRGDIIIAKCPTNPSQHICKRVIGMPGDRIITRVDPNFNTISSVPTKTIYDKYKIELRQSNGPKEDLDVPIQEEKNEDIQRELPLTEIIVPRGHVWIEGDNTKNSSDSRYYGPIPKGLIKSRAMCRIWPIENFKVLS